jgi:hypothetical protein
MNVVCYIIILNILHKLHIFAHDPATLLSATQEPGTIFSSCIGSSLSTVSSGTVAYGGHGGSEALLRGPRCLPRRTASQMTILTILMDQVLTHSPFFNTTAILPIIISSSILLILLPLCHLEFRIIQSLQTADKTRWIDPCH